jgi:hypothetical protein
LRKIAYSLLLLFATILTFSLPMMVHAPPNNPPQIGTPTISPTVPTGQSIVTVTVNVTASRNPVNNVTIVYTTDNWHSTNTTVLASYNATVNHVATAHIPALASGGHVEYYIVAYDTAGNRAVNNNSGSYFSYDVTSPTATTIGWITTAAILGAVGAAIIAFIFFVLKPTKPRTKSQNN